MMSQLTAKEVALQWFDQVWHNTNQEAIHALLAEDAIAHLEGGVHLRGPAAFADYQSQLLAGMPDMNIELLHVVADETQACVHWQATGTHKGALMGMEATNKTLSFNGMTLIIIKDGQIVEGWDCWNHGSVINAMSSAD